MTPPIVSTSPDTRSAPEQPWWARPRLVLSLLSAGVLVAALMTRTATNGRSGDQRLTTTSAEPMGAKLLYELSGRLGYETRRSQSKTIAFDPSSIVAVLDPVVEFSAEETHALLEHVRSGGSLLTVLGQGTAHLSDSIKISIDNVGSAIISGASIRRCSETRVFSTSGFWVGEGSLYALNDKDTLRAGVNTFVFVNSPSVQVGTLRTGPRRAVIGLKFGAGRIVVAGDPDVFRNDALRECTYGLDAAAVDALTYLSGGGEVVRRKIVFDEYHQKRAIVRSNSLVTKYLTAQPTGRLVLQCSFAAFVLLLGAMPRVLRPREDRMLERRSPLEHVDALARAYAGVGATRTGVQRLVRGLQRQLSGRIRNTSLHNDEEFLSRLAETKPALKADIDSIRYALNNRVSATQFLAVGHALQRVRTAISRT